MHHVTALRAATKRVAGKRLSAQLGTVVFTKANELNISRFPRFLGKGLAAIGVGEGSAKK